MLASPAEGFCDREEGRKTESLEEQPPPPYRNQPIQSPSVLKQTEFVVGEIS